MNKTKRYLLPCLKEYGEEFVNRINKLFKLAVGIGDFALVDMGIHLEKHVFILIDTKLSRKHFNETMQWLRTQEYFSLDYPFDDVHTGHLHMIAIKVPKKYENAIGRFRDSEFSKMYSLEDLKKFFDKEDEVCKILSKDTEYMIEFIDKVNRLYNTKITPETWDAELEFPIEAHEENF